MYPFGFYNYKYNKLFIIGMPLSGTTWIKNILAHVPGVFTRSTPMPKEVSNNQNICDSAFSRIPKYGNTLFKTHLNPTKDNLDCISRNGVDKILISYRDLRDVSISMYHRLVDFPKLDFPKYKNMKTTAAIDHSIETVAKDFIPWINGWLDYGQQNDSRFHFVRFEDLKYDTKNVIKNILKFYEISIEENNIDNIIKKCEGVGNVKKNMEAAKVLPWGLSTNFRSGGVGYWKDEMDSTQIENCKKYFGDILIKLNYEKDYNW